MLPYAFPYYINKEVGRYTYVTNGRICLTIIHDLNVKCLLVTSTKILESLILWQLEAIYETVNKYIGITLDIHHTTLFSFQMNSVNFNATTNSNTIL